MSDQTVLVLAIINKGAEAAYITCPQREMAVLTLIEVQAKIIRGLETALQPLDDQLGTKSLSRYSGALVGNPR